MARITPDEIDWAGSELPPRVGLTCPICASTAPAQAILQVPALIPPHTALTLLHCANCGSAFYDPLEVRDFSELDQSRKDFWRFYVEAVGGVWETIWPILAGAERGSLLDIGCGFGFALDFWQRTNRGDAIGVELSDYGVAGAQQLGLTIYRDLLQECTPLNGRKFDVVYASEVIEHVPDPGKFTQLLSGYVADDGLLILTTPRAEFITRANHSVTLLATAFPGFHGFLLSEQAFARMARDAGFPHVEVKTFNERQILWASRVPLRLSLNQATLRVSVLRFLEGRLATAGLEPAVWQGYAYRYLRDLVNTGQSADAQRVALLLSESIVRSHGELALDPKRLVPKLAAATTLSEVGRSAPYFVASFYYLVGEIARQWERDDTKAKLYYDGASAAIEACARIGSIYFLEPVSLLWHARTRGAMLDLGAGNYRLPTVMLRRLAEIGDQCSSADAYSIADPSLVETFVPMAAEFLGGRGIWPEATALSDAYRAYVRRHYGEPMLTAAGIAAALGDAHRLIPSDASFPVWFDGMRDAANAGGKAPDSAALQAIIDMGHRFGHHPQQGARMRERALRARQWCGREQPLWSSAVTYTLTKGGPR